MTIDERITESKKSIKVPPFDFDKAFERIKSRKKRKDTSSRKSFFLFFLPAWLLQQSFWQS